MFNITEWLNFENAHSQGRLSIGAYRFLTWSSEALAISLYTRACAAAFGRPLLVSVCQAVILRWVEVTIRPYLGGLMSLIYRCTWAPLTWSPWATVTTILACLILGVKFILSQPPDLPTYKREKLKGSRQIRLLRVYRQRWLAGVIYCRMEHVSLDDKPSYEAMSYTWGDVTQMRQIMVNGCWFQVPLNVHLMLTDLLAAGEDRLLWIDYVCIDQKDLVEKSQQVQLMRDIFRCASRVIAWMGQADDAKLALELITELHATENGATLSKEELYTKISFERSSPRWRALMTLLAHPWMTRIWIVQEAAVAPAQLLILYGGQYMYCEYLMSTAALFSTPPIGNLLHWTSDHHTVNQDFSSLGGLVAMTHLRDQQKEGRPDTLANALMACGTFNATNPRDHVYALLGVARTLEPTPLLPDYTLPVSEVYEATARRILSTGDLVIIRRAGTSNQNRASTTSDKQMPSWVPDWRIRPKSSDMLFDNENQKYRAASNSRPEVIIGNSGPIKIRGMKIDKILNIGGVFTPGSPPNDTADSSLDVKSREIHRQSWFNEARSIADQSARKLYPTREKREDAFWRTLMGDQGPQSRPATNEAVATCKAWFGLLKYSVNYFYEASDEEIRRVFSPTPDDPELDPEAREARRAIMAVYGDTFAQFGDMCMAASQLLSKDNLAEEESTRLNNLLAEVQDNFDLKTMSAVGPGRIAIGADQKRRQGLLAAESIACAANRRFCVTEKGRMGLVASDANAGDFVCVLFGEGVPFVLRENTMNRQESCSSYALVGTCYIHGVMDGEALQGQSSKEWFTLT